MTNIASGDSEHVQILIEKGAVQILAQLLLSDRAEVVEQAIWGLGNIAGD